MHPRPMDDTSRPCDPRRRCSMQYLHSRLSHVAGWRGDETYRAIVEEVVPGPRPQRDDAAAESHQIQKVNEEPHEPADEPIDVDGADLGNGRTSSHRGHGALVAVVENG